MATPFSALVTQLSQLGFYEFLLPWLFVFAIVYGLLSKADIFGSVNKKVSGIIALVIAFFITPYAGPALASYFAIVFGGASKILAGILVIILFAVLVGIEDGLGGASKWIKRGGAILFIIIAVILMIIGAGGEIYLGALGASWGFAAIFMILVVVLAIAFMMGEGENGSTDNE